MLTRDWIDWTNSGIGAAGLLLTVATLLLAKKAKEAASEARNAAMGRNLADLFAETVHSAGSLSERVDLERWPDVRIQLNELILRLARHRSSFVRHYEPLAPKMYEVETDCSDLQRMLSSFEEEVGIAVKRRIIKQSYKITKDLNTLLGQINDIRNEEER